MADGCFIRFVAADGLLSSRRLTKVWNVVDEFHSERLGVVKWYSRWRKYAFFPEGDCLFEESCLRDIALFIERETGAHKTSRRKA